MTEKELRKENEIPEWIIKYDQQNYNSGAGKAIRFLIQYCKDQEELLKAAEDVIVSVEQYGEFHLPTLEKYNSLKKP